MLHSFSPTLLKHFEVPFFYTSRLFHTISIYCPNIISLDLLAIDDEGTNYDAEMQNNSTNPNRKKELSKRSRYYQCMLDGQLIDAGEDYLSLSNSYIIFIYDFDPFDANRYQYTSYILAKKMLQKN